MKNKEKIIIGISVISPRENRSIFDGHKKNWEHEFKSSNKTKLTYRKKKFL